MRLFDQPLLAAVVSLAVVVVGFAASELALGQVLGPASVAIANIGLVALLTATWFWALAERRGRDLNSAIMELNEARRRIDQLQREQPGLARWQREAIALGRRVEAFDNERTRYENALGAIASRGTRPVHHRQLTIVFEVGESAQGDRTTEQYSTMAGDPTRPILWHDVRIGVSGAGTPRLRSFRDLDDLQASQDLYGETIRIDPIPAGHIGGKVRALILFEPPIGDRPRDWSWSYRWPIWDPLRRTGHDRFEFEVLKDVRYEVLEIQVIFPRNVLRPSMHPLDNSFTPVVLPRDKNDRQALGVRLENPQPDLYSWMLGAREWEVQSR